MEGTAFGEPSPTPGAASSSASSCTSTLLKSIPGGITCVFYSLFTTTLYDQQVGSMDTDGRHVYDTEMDMGHGKGTH